MVVQNWGSLIENQEIDIVAVEAGHDLRDELCPIPECAFFNDSFIDINRDVDVAAGLSPALRVRSEQISLLEPRGEVRAGSQFAGSASGRASFACRQSAQERETFAGR